MDKLHGKHLRVRTSHGSNQGRIPNLDWKSCHIMQTSHSRVRGIWRNQNEKGQKSSQHISVKTSATVSLSSKEHHFVRRFRMEVIFPSKFYHPKYVHTYVVFLITIVVNYSFFGEKTTTILKPDKVVHCKSSGTNIKLILKYPLKRRAP